MNNTRYIFDPGLPDETGFYYPITWELGGWPSTLGKQAERWYDHLDEDDKNKPYHACLSHGGRHFEIFVNSQEELLEYARHHGIELDPDAPFCWNNGEVYPNFY